MTRLYGIPNCQTVKKAQLWLLEHNIDFEFINFKKDMPTPQLIQSWLRDVPLSVLLNKRGTTWRKLTLAEQVLAEDETQAILLMCGHPSLIKRPVLMHESMPTIVGFSAEQYQEHFQK